MENLGALGASTLVGRKILVLTAHPDDESFLAGGTLAASAQAGGETFLVCATLGEKGKSHLKEPMSEQQLAEVRQKELQAAARVLGVTEVHQLGFPDGKANEHEEEIYAQSLKIARQVNPEILMGFGLDGITGHKDHVAVGRVAEKLAQELSLPLATFCLPKETLNEAKQWLIARRATKGHYEEDFTLREGNIQVEINPAIKLAALQTYVSQIGSDNPYSGYPEHIARVMSRVEAFFIDKSDHL
jgi:N-acetylglucosamine malate deacetylase 2